MTDKPPLFSIVTITYNNIEGLQKTHKSLKAQSLTDYEWIIVDGGSDDGTKEYVESHTRLPDFVSEPDNGIYHAMNKGLERAKGEYILFLNAGDCLADQDILATMEKSIKAFAPDFLYGDSTEGIDEKNAFYKKARNHRRYLWGMFTHHQAMLYKRTSIKSLRYSEHYKIASDYLFTVQFLKNIKDESKIHYIPCAICLFETGGISQQNDVLGRKEQADIKKRLALCEDSTISFIAFCQKMTMLLKTRVPEVYKILKIVF